MSYAGKTVGLWVGAEIKRHRLTGVTATVPDSQAVIFCDIPRKILPVIRLLIFPCIVISGYAEGYAVGYSEQFKVPTIIRPGFPVHRFLGKVNLVLHGCAIAMALTLPPLTDFRGITSLSYLFGALGGSFTRHLPVASPCIGSW